MCVKENYTSEVLFICVFIALLWGAGNINNNLFRLESRRLKTRPVVPIGNIALQILESSGPIDQRNGQSNISL